LSSPVDPHAIRTASETVSAVIRELEDDVAPERAAVLLAQVLAPDTGMLSQLSALLDSAAHYAQRHGARPNVYRAFGDAAENLLAHSEELGDATQSLGQLRTATPPYANQQLPPAPAPRVPSVRR
jgi:hypothetical protein